MPTSCPHPYCTLLTSCCVCSGGDGSTVVDGCAGGDHCKEFRCFDSLQLFSHSLLSVYNSHKDMLKTRMHEPKAKVARSTTAWSAGDSASTVRSVGVSALIAGSAVSAVSAISTGSAVVTASLAPVRRFVCSAWQMQRRGSGERSQADG
jgi:hypothetical protein